VGLVTTGPRSATFSPLVAMFVCLYITYYFLPLLTWR
jgi:hypothetical protein